VALFSVGRLITALLVTWADKAISHKAVYDLSLLLSVAGCVLYFFGMELGLPALVVGRVVMGFGTGDRWKIVGVYLVVCVESCVVLPGTLGTPRAVVVSVTNLSNRTFYMAVLDTCRFFGFAITPALGWVLSLSHDRSDGIFLDDVTLPGLLLACFNAILLLWSFWPVVSHVVKVIILCKRCGYGVPDAETATEESGDTGASQSAPGDSKLQPLLEDHVVIYDGKIVQDDEQGDQEAVERPFPVPSKPKPVAYFKTKVVILLFMNVVSRGLMALLETIGTPMFINVKETLPNGQQTTRATEVCPAAPVFIPWPTSSVILSCLQSANEFFLYLGIIGLAVYLVVTISARKNIIPELYALSAAFVFACVGCCVVVRHFFFLF
jgi:hypothetical protein